MPILLGFKRLNHPNCDTGVLCFGLDF